LPGIPTVKVRRCASEPLDSPSGVRYRPVHHLASGRRGPEEQARSGISIPRAEQEVIMNDEQPDWNFWCFITSLLDLLIQLATLQ
jgi:hypothetical protein